jgi:hypothetical protein
MKAGDMRDVRLRKPQIGLQERGATQRLQIVQTADRQATLDQIYRQIGTDLRPQRRHQHGHKMATHRMSGQEDTIRVMAQRISLAIQPCHRLQCLTHDRFNGHVRAQRVLTTATDTPRRVGTLATKL